MKYLKYTILGVIITLVIYSLIIPATALTRAELEPSEPIEEDFPIGKEHYQEAIAFFSKKYNVSQETIERIMICENVNFEPEKQSLHKYNQGQISRNPSWGKVGDREKSFGLVQIHLPAGHKWKGQTITKEMAQDPFLSIEFLAYHLSKGEGRWWSCY